jgi:environmental stress-induced protein Ves
MVRRLTSTDYRRMPWRNGGGTTTEITLGLLPDHLGRERFLYRVSIADVASDGPFSRFEGYDRHIMLVSGAGMTIDCGPNGRLDLGTLFEPRTFSGDWDVTGKLLAGPVRDFNLIVDRASAASSLEVHMLTEQHAISVAAGDTCIIHLIEGDLTEAEAGDTLVAVSSCELVPRTSARVAIASVRPRATSLPGAAS